MRSSAIAERPARRSASVEMLSYCRMNYVNRLRVSLKSYYFVLYDISVFKMTVQQTFHFCYSNKWLKNFDKRPHRRRVTPLSGEWILSTLSPT